jgi:hypothetical protein
LQGEDRIRNAQPLFRLHIRGEVLCAIARLRYGHGFTTASRIASR